MQNAVRNKNPFRHNFGNLLVLVVKIAATRAVFPRTGYLNRAESAILSVIVVFAIANVAFDTVVFILHIKTSF